MGDNEELERLLRELRQKTGKNLWLQTEDGQVLASTFSEKERFMRDAVEGIRPLSEVRRQADLLGLNFHSGRYLFLIQADGLSRNVLAEAAEAILGDCVEHELCVRSERGQILLLVMAGSDGEAEEDGLLLQNALETEAMVRVKIGISDCFVAAELLPRAAKEAETALLAIHTFSPSQKVMLYRNLGLALAALQLSEECAEAYLRSVLGETPERVLEDEELLKTAKALLASGLNSAETARQLCVHRNTLIYRLDKIQKLCGRDLRRFEDAAAFQLAAMIWKKREAGYRYGK